MPRGRLLVGIIIIVFGVIALLNGLGYTQLSFWEIIATYWPLLLIGWGVGFMLERSGASGKVLGAIVILIGLGLMGNNFGWFTFNFWQLLWPVFLIFLGIRFLMGNRDGGRTNFAFMGGIDRKDAWQMDNGSYWAFMGGIELDLRQAVIPHKTTYLSVTAIMGGVEIIVPPELRVVCEGTSMLGGVQFFDKSNGGIIANLYAEQGDPQDQKQIRINCLVLMGGVEVKAAAPGEKVRF
ncbi:MAG: cell wall-active antibiotics response protein [Firmicutes bacterium]|nr:cell wall-active antibiotics response protein [Bacillota bacterium]